MKKRIIKNKYTKRAKKLARSMRYYQRKIIDEQNTQYAKQLLFKGTIEADRFQNYNFKKASKLYREGGFFIVRHRKHVNGHYHYYTKREFHKGTSALRLMRTKSKNLATHGYQAELWRRNYLKALANASIYINNKTYKFVHDFIANLSVDEINFLYDIGSLPQIAYIYILKHNFTHGIDQGEINGLQRSSVTMNILDAMEILKAKPGIDEMLKNDKTIIENIKQMRERVDAAKELLDEKRKNHEIDDDDDDDEDYDEYEGE